MTQAAAFAHPFMYWVGMDTDPRTTPEALAEFNRFYSTTHVGEVVAGHSGFVSASRFELVEPDPRGGVHAGPRWLAVYGMADEASALQYLKDNERPWLHRKRYSPWPSARRRAKTVWRMIWGQISTTGATNPAPESVVLVGTNVPADADADGMRLELYREFAHPAPGCPRFCTIYEAAATTEAPETHRAPGGALASGPPASEQDDTVWRLVYRRIPPPE